VGRCLGPTRVYCPAAGGQRFTGQAAGSHKSVHSVVLLPARRELPRSGTWNLELWPSGRTAGDTRLLYEDQVTPGMDGFRGERGSVTLGPRSPMDAVS